MWDAIDRVADALTNPFACVCQELDVRLPQRSDQHAGQFGQRQAEVVHLASQASVCPGLAARPAQLLPPSVLQPPSRQRLPVPPPTQLPHRRRPSSTTESMVSPSRSRSASSFGDTPLASRTSQVAGPAAQVLGPVPQMPRMSSGVPPPGPCKSAGSTSAAPLMELARSLGGQLTAEVQSLHARVQQLESSTFDVSSSEGDAAARLRVERDMALVVAMAAISAHFEPRSSHAPPWELYPPQRQDAHEQAPADTRDAQAKASLIGTGRSQGSTHRLQQELDRRDQHHNFQVKALEMQIARLSRVLGAESEERKQSGHPVVQPASSSFSPPPQGPTKAAIRIAEARDGDAELACASSFAGSECRIDEQESTCDGAMSETTVDLSVASPSWACLPQRKVVPCLSGPDRAIPLDEEHPRNSMRSSLEPRPRPSSPGPLPAAVAAMAEAMDRSSRPTGRSTGHSSKRLHGELEAQEQQHRLSMEAMHRRFEDLEAALRRDASATTKKAAPTALAAAAAAPKVAELATAGDAGEGVGERGASGGRDTTLLSSTGSSL
mmetsp:Transcript_93253/g.301618  ORF Transcript_93253/g.301618 Transcript_93253/m.301618 type:complete len:551 (-) Transcript_93253:63-1715(-)